MSVIDPVADMLTRVRNACSAGPRRADMPVSKLKVEIARILRDNHYIQDYKVLDDGRHGLLRLYLKYHNDAPVIRELQRVSAPGLRRYVKAREIPRVRNGLGMAILSTPQGLMSDREARTARIGGELLALIWEEEPCHASASGPFRPPRASRRRSTATASPSKGRRASSAARSTPR